MIDKKNMRLAGIDAKFLLSNDKTAPLLYMVHGRAGTNEVMWAFRRCAPNSFSIVTPQAPTVDQIGGFSWWQVAPKPDGIEVAVSSSELFLDFCDKFESYHNLEPVTRLAVGFSQGAVLLSLAMQSRPKFFHGIGLLAGFVLEHPNSDGYKGLESKPEVFMAHGSEDDVISIDRAIAGYQLLESWGVEVDFHQDPVGHKIGSKGMKALKDWLFSFS